MQKKPVNNLAKVKRVIQKTQKTERSMLFEKFKDVVFSTDVAKRVCHIPYKRLSDWDKKNVLPHHDREVTEGWRTFSLYNLLVIKIIALLRENGIPMPKVKRFCTWLNAKEESICKTYGDPQLSTYIFTNFKDTHVMLPEKIFANEVESRGDLLFALKLNPILDELLEELNK